MSGSAMNYRTNALNFLMGKKEYIAAISFIAFFSLVFVDIGMDVLMGLPLQHMAREIAIEALIIFTAAVSILMMCLKYFEEKQNSIKSASELQTIKSTKDKPNEFNKVQLRLNVDRRLEEWGLSKSEQDIAILILKGLEHQQIAELRNTSEKTVRNQAQTIYEKSGTSGRTELSALFLKELIF